VRDQKREILSYHHKLVMLSVVGTGLTLPFDVEPYGPGNSEYNAGRRFLRRAVGNFEHICHHERHPPVGGLAVWLLTYLALTRERLYRVRYLHRGTHPILEAIILWQLLWLSLSRPVPDDTS
jgi:hypothetical protein